LKQDFGLGHYEGRVARVSPSRTLCIAAYGFLLGRNDSRLALMPAVKKTSFNAKCLPFPKITSLGAVQRAQRHVPDSITTLRRYLGVALASALGHCPQCHRGKPKITFMTQ